MYDAAIQYKVKGLVYAGMGAGSVSKRSDVGIRKVEAKDIVVARSSRTGSGVVPPDSNQPGLVSNSLNPAKSRILLILALTKTDNQEIIQQHSSAFNNPASRSFHYNGHPR